MAGRGSTDADEVGLLQELQHHIDGMSLQDSLRSLSAAERQLQLLRQREAEVERARKLQRDAQNAVASASAALGRASQQQRRAAAETDAAWQKYQRELALHAESVAEETDGVTELMQPGASGNGSEGSSVETEEAKADGFCWSQGDDSVSISMDVPAQLRPLRAKDVQCTFSATALMVSVKGSPLLGGELAQSVIVEDCTWGLVDGAVITIELCKAKQRIRWESVLKEQAVASVDRQRSASSDRRDICEHNFPARVATDAEVQDRAKQPDPRLSGCGDSNEAPAAALVRVFLTPILEESHIRTGGFVRVQYEFNTNTQAAGPAGRAARAFNPTESDAVGVFLAERVSTKPVRPSDFKEARHESFEFFPSSAGKGVIDIPLPEFGGRFALQIIPAQEHEGHYVFAPGSNTNTVSVPISLSPSQPSTKAVATNLGDSVRCVLEIYKNIERLHVNIFLVDSTKHFLCRPVAWLRPPGHLVLTVTEACRNLPDGCRCGDRSHNLCLRLPEQAQQAIRSAGVTGEVSEDGCMMVRIPYAALECSQLDAPAALTAHAARGIYCAFCGATVVRPGVLRDTTPLPTGYFDSMLEDIVCCENPVQPLASDTVTAKAGVCLTGTSTIVLHPGDVVPEASLSAESQQGHFGRGIHCPRCEMYIGEATMAPEFEEGSTTPKLQGFGVVDVSLPFYRVALQDASHETTRLASYEQVLASAVASTWHGYGCSLTILYSRELPDQVLLLRALSSTYAVQLADTPLTAALQCNFNNAVRVCYREITLQHALQHAPAFDSPVTTPAFVAELGAAAAEGFQLSPPKSGRGLGLGLRCRWLTVQADEFLQARDVLSSNTDRLPLNQRRSPFAGFNVGFLAS